MIRTKKILALTCVFAALVGAYILTTLFTQKQIEDETVTETQGEYVLSALDAQTITGLEWTMNGESYALTHASGAWTLTGKANFRVNAEVINALAEKVTNIVATRKLESAQPLSTYGLDEPICTVAVTDEAGNVKRFSIGDQNDITQEYYLRMDGEEGVVYMIANSFAPSFAIGEGDMYLYDTLPTYDTIMGVTLETTVETHSIQYVEDVSALDYANTHHYYAADEGKYVALDDDLATELIDAIQALEWNDLQQIDADEEALASYGFDGEQTIINVDFVKDDTRLQFRIELGGEASSGYRYARLPGANTVYTVDDELFMLASAYTPESYRSKSLIMASAETITKIAVEYAGAKLTLVNLYETVAVPAASGSEASDSEPETAYELVRRVTRDGGAEIATDAFDSILTALNAMSTGDKSESAGETLITITLTRDAETFAETFAETTLIFSEYDAENYTVDAFGQRRLVTASEVDAMIRNIKVMMK